MSDTKRILPLFSFYDVTGMEHYLEEQAAKGWMLESMTSFGWKFRRITPKTVHFAVTYFPKDGKYSPDKSEGKLTLVQYCAAEGWKQIAANGTMLVFANEKAQPTPIHTDPEPELENMEKMGKFSMMAWMVLFLITGFNALLFVGRMLRDTIGLLADGMSLVNGVTMSLLFLYFMLEMFTWSRWRRGAHMTAAHGKFMPTKGHHRFITTTLILFAAGIAYVLVTDRQPGLRFMLMALLLAVAALYCLIRGIRLLKTRKGPAVVHFLVALAIVGGTVGYFFQADLSHVRTAAGMELTVETLTGQEALDDVKQASPRSSLFISDLRCMQRPHDEEEDQTNSLSYHLIDVHMPMLYDRCLDQLLHQYDEVDKHKDHKRKEPAYRFREEDPALFGADKVFRRQHKGKDEGHFLVCWEGRFLEIEAGWALTHEQMAVIGSTFAPQN